MKRMKNLGVIVILFIVLFPVKQAIATSFSTRLSIPVSSNATLVVENKNGIESQSALISDSLSSTKVILNSDGTTTATPHYYPYGSSYQSYQSYPTDRFYTGQRQIPDDTLYNYNARYYNPALGLFTQPDIVQGLNRFAYVAGNPIMKNDPTGNSMTPGGDGGGGDSSARFPQTRNAPPKDYYKEFIGVADNPVQATKCSTDYTLCTIGKINGWTGGIYTVATLGNSELSPVVSSSKQYMSQREAEAAYMVRSAILAMIQAKGMGALSTKLDSVVAGAEDAGTLGKGGFGNVDAVGNEAYKYVRKMTPEEFYDYLGTYKTRPPTHEEFITHEISTVMKYEDSGILPKFYGPLHDDAGELIGYRMERIFGEPLSNLIGNTSSRSLTGQEALSFYHRLDDLYYNQGFIHGDVSWANAPQRNIMVSFGQKGADVRLIDPMFSPWSDKIIEGQHIREALNRIVDWTK